MKSVLVLLAHPNRKNSVINSALFNAVKDIEDVTLVDLYEEYPNFDIDTKREQQRLVEHDTIIFLFPVHWYSTPALLKEWQDCVLEYGFAYGTSGDKLKGKKLVCVTSTGSSITRYQHRESNQLIIRDLLLPIEKMAEDTGLIFKEPLVLYGARTAKAENRLQSHIETFSQLVHAETN